MDFVDKVVKFNEIAGNTKDFQPNTVGLYYGLIFEELAETVEALPNRPAFDHMILVLNHWSRRFKEGDFNGNIEDIDPIKALDGFVDLAVVALGGACSLGADVQGACHEIADSNLSKTVELDGKMQFIKNENGKVIKPDSYWRPDLTKFV